MNPEERLRFMRERFGRSGAKAHAPLGMHCAATGTPQTRKPKTVIAPPANPAAWRSRGFGVFLHDRWAEERWIAKADPKPETKLAHQRKARVSPLVRIAAQLNQKLKRVIVDEQPQQ